MTSRRAFGEVLRSQREQRGITLETISDLTKISTTLLAALEQGDCSRWPGGIYSRAYIRDYAQAIGLDRDEVVERFTQCFAETAFPDGLPDTRPAAAPHEAPATPLRLGLGEDPRERRRDLAGRALAVTIDLLVALVVAAVLHAALGRGFWVGLACVSLGLHAAGVLGGGAHTWDLLARLSMRRPGRRAETPATDRALAEAA